MKDIVEDKFENIKEFRRMSDDEIIELMLEWCRYVPVEKLPSLVKSIIERVLNP